MNVTQTADVAAKRGAQDAGKYFRYMADFVEFTAADADAIKHSAPIIEKHLPEIVSKFYAHLLRYPPTRKFFLKKDGAIDQEYVELRMRHLTNFWIRTAQAVYDDDYARYVDYVGRAHTSHGADPRIYIAERYVIGQVGFIQHAIMQVLMQDLHTVDEDLGHRAIDAWDKLLMVILEMLSRAYNTERETETFEALTQVDVNQVEQLAAEAFALEHDKAKPVAMRAVIVARADEIPEGERKLVQIGDLSIGVFYHRGKWIAIRNWCLHRGGPVATGCLEGDTLTCPWHGFEYAIDDGHLLVDPSAKLDLYAVAIRDGQIEIQVPDVQAAPKEIGANEFRPRDVPPGKIKRVRVNGANVAVYNVGGTFFATQDECTHAGGPLSESDLAENVVTCALHGSQFDVTTGAVARGPAQKSLMTYRVVVAGDVARVEQKTSS
ncbi:MAG: Rieske 2Fe-2S domain-containing protein [Chloroflexi bacterium]|nr:Rieske 2Fe-2S domain-containing protein [Chloroflexota bacterium]